jgi:hypothetical protein
MREIKRIFKRIIKRIFKRMNFAEPPPAYPNRPQGSGSRE